jgi:hypothetical protein
MHASALICLGAGAGLIGGDLREVTGNDVLERSAGVIVVVGGAHGRSVPVLRRFSERLLECSAFSMGDYLIGGQSRSRRNVTTPLINYLAGGTELGRLDPRRLRSTWLSSCADQMGLRAFLDAAGVICSQRLGDICSLLDPIDEPRAVELLGARRF